jgi:methylamine utilization protein MauE
VLKLRDPAAGEAALATYGLRRAGARRAVWGAVIAVELALAVGLALGSAVAAYLAAVLFAGFALALGLALARGRRGEPCGCLGGRSRIGPFALLRAVALAGACAAVPALHGVGEIAALAIALLALAWELGELRPRRVPRGALEIPDEGPEVGSRGELLSAVDAPPSARLALAVFTSEGCEMCRTLEPAVEHFARDPLVALRRFDERRDAAAWRALDVPGSPYAVALGLDGTVLAKGTFNSLGQLESVLATAERRERPRPEADAAPRRAGVGGTSRRGLLARGGEAVVGLAAGRLVAAAIKPGDAEAYHFCGHTFTTASCPHPTGLPRIDAHGYPLRARDGRPIDDLGRLIDRHGRPVDERGHALRDPDGHRLPSAPRSKICVRAGRDRHFRTWIDGSWYRCCGGHVRRLMDCCSYHSNRINGDSALTGYCYSGRKVFCTMYYDTHVPC